MQSRNKILDDVSQLMTNAMGVAQGAREEAETAVKSVIDRWLADHDFVTREEFDAVKAMAQKAREENENLKARLDAIEKKRKKYLSCFKVLALFKIRKTLKDMVSEFFLFFFKIPLYRLSKAKHHM